MAANSAVLSDAALFDNLAEERRAYGIAVGAGQTAPASACSECGQCVEACPQQLDVTRELAGVARTFAEEEPES